MSPPGLDIMIDNAKEIAELMEKIRVRRLKLAELDYKLNPREKGPGQNMIEKGFKPSEPSGMPRNYLEETENLEEARRRWRNGVFFNQQRLKIEEARLKGLEAENEARRRGQQPPRTPTEPSLDEPEVNWEWVADDKLVLP